MSLQKEVRITQAFGVPGEFYDTTPRRVTAYALETEGVIGRACTLGGSDGKIKKGGTGVFAGILMAPKQHVRPGTEFSATMKLPVETQVEAATAGRLIVTLTTDAKPGDTIGYAVSNGELCAVPNPESPGAGINVIPGARVALFTVNAGGPAVMEM